MKARADLEKTCNSFFAEYLRSSDDTNFFFDEEKMRRITEYLLYQQENIKRDIKKQKNYTRLAAYNDYEFLDKFLHDDEFLAKQVGFSLEETREFFTDDVRKKLAINNLSNPLDAVIRVKENYTKVLTDENIFAELNKDPNVQFEMKEVKELFTDGVRKILAVRNISNPLEAVIRVKENYTKILTDENIFTELNKDSDVTFDMSEVKELFTDSVRKYFAVGNIESPILGLCNFITGKIASRKYNLKFSDNIKLAAEAYILKHSSKK